MQNLVTEGVPIGFLDVSESRAISDIVRCSFLTTQRYTGSKGSFVLKTPDNSGDQIHSTGLEETGIGH